MKLATVGRKFELTRFRRNLALLMKHRSCFRCSAETHLSWEVDNRAGEAKCSLLPSVRSIAFVRETVSTIMYHRKLYIR